MSNQYSDNFKKRTLKWVEKNGVKKAARRMKVSTGTVYNWVQQSKAFKNEVEGEWVIGAEPTSPFYDDSKRKMAIADNIIQQQKDLISKLTRRANLSRQLVNTQNEISVLDKEVLGLENEIKRYT